MRFSFGFSLILAVLCLTSVCSPVSADDTDTTPTPPNQNDVKVDKTESKGAVTGVQSQPAGVHAGSGSLDPSQQSSVGVGIQIPFHREKETPPADKSNDSSN